MTSNGKPIAILTGVSDEDLEETLRTLRQVRTEVALGKVRKASVETGANRLSEQEIAAEIRSLRRARKA